MTDKADQLRAARDAVRAQDYAAAYALYDRLLADDPADVVVLTDYGRAKYREYVDLSGATALFERALDAAGRDLDVMLWLAELWSLGYGRGYAEAARLYRYIIQAQPQNVDAYLGLGMLEGAPGSPVTLSEAIQAFAHAVRLEPGRLDSRLDLGAALLTAGDRANALLQLQAVAEGYARAGDARRAHALAQLIQRIGRNELVSRPPYVNESTRYLWPPTAG